MYLIIDAQYRIYKSEILSGYVRSQARNGMLSVVNLKTMKGINYLDYGSSPYPDTEEWSDVQEWDPSFNVEAS